MVNIRCFSLGVRGLHSFSKPPFPIECLTYNKLVTPFRQRLYSTQPPSDLPKGPLNGIRVLDFTRILAGPFCTQIFADYGADVIKVEVPGKGDETRSWQTKGESASWKQGIGPMSFFFASINRSKRSIALDLKKDEGKEVIQRLVKDGKIDVLVENFVPGTMDRLGIGYDTLSKLNPRLIFASISGYGPSGPHGSRAGYDAIANAEGGLMHITGHPDAGPVRAGVGLTDIATGLYIHGAVMAALYNREKTGRGQCISASLFETTVSMLTSVGAHWLNLGKEEQRYGAGHPSVVPYNAWECQDGIWMVVAANSDKQYKIFCERMERTDFLEDEKYKTNALRVENRKELDREIAEVIRTKSSDEWLRILDGSGLAHGPVNTIEKAFQHPQIEAREMVKEIPWDLLNDRSWKAIGVPVKFSETKGAVRGPASVLGGQSEDILSEAGYEKDEIERLKQDKVI